MQAIQQYLLKIFKLFDICCKSNSKNCVNQAISHIYKINDHNACIISEISDISYNI